MAHFKKKQAGSKQEVPTSAMPDVVFMLLFFFMVTTVLREVTLKVKVDLTAAGNIEKIEEKVKALVEECVEFAENSEFPIPEEAFMHVYAEEDYPFIRE